MSHTIFGLLFASLFALSGCFTRPNLVSPKFTALNSSYSLEEVDGWLRNKTPRG